MYSIDYTHRSFLNTGYGVKLIPVSTRGETIGESDEYYFTTYPQIYDLYKEFIRNRDLEYGNPKYLKFKKMSPALLFPFRRDLETPASKLEIEYNIVAMKKNADKYGTAYSFPYFEMNFVSEEDEYLDKVFYEQLFDYHFNDTKDDMNALKSFAFTFHMSR